MRFYLSNYKNSQLLKTKLGPACWALVRTRILARVSAGSSLLILQLLKRCPERSWSESRWGSLCRVAPHRSPSSPPLSWGRPAADTTPPPGAAEGFPCRSSGPAGRKQNRSIVRTGPSDWEKKLSKAKGKFWNSGQKWCKTTVSKFSQ